MSPSRPQTRDDLVTLDGYHSPQLDVDVRLNTNESPEPPPREFTAALTERLAELDWHRYPDRGAGELRERLAEHHGVAAGMVFAANGSNEVIQSILLAYGGPGRRAAVFEPTYAMHGQIARVTGTAVVEGERSADFALDLDAAERLIGASAPAVTFLCSPNNPTGVVDAPEAVAHVLELVEPHRGLVVVDEAYGQFAPHSALGHVAEDTALVVTRTYSKTWAMAAARLGYLIGPTWLVEALEKVVLPYHLAATTQAAGIVALDFVAEMEARVARLVEQRGRLAGRLAELEVDVWPSGANFVLFRPRGVSGDEVWRALTERSILVRNCSSWPRLADCLRVTIGSPPENDAFLDALEDILS